MSDFENLQASPLRIGISTRALFDLEYEHSVFLKDGVRAYIDLQRERERDLIPKGPGFEVVSRLLNLNEGGEKPVVEVIILSKNSPDLSLRAFNSIREYGLNIKTGSFTSGRSLAPFVNAWDIDLFLSNDVDDVKAATDGRVASARLGKTPSHRVEISADEVRIAFDGDAVVFSAESDNIYAKEGLQAFLEHERMHAQNPMQIGPFGNFLKKLSALRRAYLFEEEVSKVRIAIVTARNAPAHERVIHTLRDWGTPADEAHFVGARDKSSILKAFGAHIFFDDQEKHVMGAASVVPSALVPGPHLPDRLIIPAA
ncbi:MAG: 5'-nucleotidase [Mesorhizobium sp.]